MGKTIEERADDYAKSQSNWITTYDTSLAKHYIAGATEQKAIDIDKACESVCRLCANCECCSQKDRRECPTIDSFRKTMMNN